MPTAPAPGIAQTALTAALTSVQMCAVAGAVKEAALKKAKAELPDNTNVPIDLTLRLTGHVAKGQTEPASHGISPAFVGLESLGVFAAVLRRLKIEPAALRKALRAELKAINNPADVGLLGQDAPAQALRAEIEQEATRTAARLPAQPWSRAGRAAAVTSQIAITILEASCSDATHSAA